MNLGVLPTLNRIQNGASHQNPFLEICYHWLMFAAGLFIELTLIIITVIIMFYLFCLVTVGWK